MKRAGLAVLFLTSLAAGATISAPAADAASNCTYYSDDSRTTVVGRFGYDCCNNKVAWGVKTQYAECGACFVCYPPPAE